MPITRIIYLRKSHNPNNPSFRFEIGWGVCRSNQFSLWDATDLVGLLWVIYRKSWGRMCEDLVNKRAARVIEIHLRDVLQIHDSQFAQNGSWYFMLHQHNGGR
jgi:hypothetical protein